MPFTSKLTRTMIKKTKQPWGIIPATERRSSVVTNGHLAVAVTPFEANKFSLTIGLELEARPTTAHQALPVYLSKAKELRRTCVLSDEAHRTSRAYLESNGKAYFFDVTLLRMISNPKVMWTVNGEGPVVDKVDNPSFWIMRVRTDEAESILNARAYGGDG